MDDLFSDLLPLLRVRPELQRLCQFGAQWAAPHEEEEHGWAPFHIVTAGACLLEIRGEKTVLLSAGDVAILPHGSPHITRALPDHAGASLPFRSLTRKDGLELKTNIEGKADIELICGRLKFENAHHNLVVAALPAMVLLQGQDAARVTHIVEMMRRELDEERLGAASIVLALANSLMIFALRAHLQQAVETQGIFALLAGRQTARALAAMLGDPGRAWTLDDLAERALSSRATLVRQFQSAVGMAPIGFLTEIRLGLARGKIRASRASLAAIAEEVGYQSETAFSRAYQRRFGVPPGADRNLKI